MIKGHGDDAYLYDNIRMNFSSNICQQHDLSVLKGHLASRLDLIANYPEPEAWTLERLIAKQLGVSADCLLVTNGATEAIYLTAQTFRMLHEIPQPTFHEYADAVSLFPTIDKSRRALWLCNPNNPTGRVLSREELRQPLQQYDLVVIDQSYEDYSDIAPLTAKEAVAAANVIQIHSLTKRYGVPGLRIGFVVAAAPLAEALRRHKQPWSVNALAIEAGSFLTAHCQPVRPNLEEARRLAYTLSQTAGITVEASHTNFMLCQSEPCTAAELKDYLARQHGMLIRDASNFEGLTPHHFRIAAQTPEENDALVWAIQSFL